MLNELGKYKDKHRDKYKDMTIGASGGTGGGRGDAGVVQLHMTNTILVIVTLEILF